jgi:DNA-binding LytR/AlgR family response regulator
MKAVIVDDEPRAIALLESYIQHFNSIELVASFRNGLKALEYLSKEKVDLIFLDINMPHITGIALSRLIHKDVKLIFTTAYSEYAVESYEVEAVDYLLKPISLERFSKAVSKLLAAEVQAKKEQPEIIHIKSGNRVHRVDVTDILYLEKDGNYMTYHEPHRKILARQTVGDALTSLPPQFIQAHKSFVINLDKVTSVDKDFVYINEVAIPIGSSFNLQLRKRL